MNIKVIPGYTQLPKLPALMVSRIDPELVVLFVTPTTGIRLSKSENTCGTVGSYESGWISYDESDTWVPFHGQVVIVA